MTFADHNFEQVIDINTIGTGGKMNAKRKINLRAIPVVIQPNV